MKHILIFLLVFQAILSFAQPVSFAPRGIGGGGALFFPTINPANDNEFYVACDMSELFHSTDYGNSYDFMPFTRFQSTNHSTYEFTNLPAIAYSIFNDGNNGYPVKTTDGGQSWTQITGYDIAQYDAPYRLVAHYENPKQLLINGYGDIVFSNDGGQTFSLVKHTVNNGAGLVMGGVFWEGNHIYIGTNEGLIISNNGGQSFQVQNTTGIAAGEVIWSFVGGKSANLTRFTCITASINDVYNGIQPFDYYGLAKGVYTMDHADGVWHPRASGIDFSNDFVMYAAMARNNTDVIYLGGSDNSQNAALVFKSTDGGLNWNKVFKSENNQNITTGWSGYQGDRNWSWGETCFGLTVAPNNANKLMFGDFGFVHVSADGGISWKQAYVRNSDQHPAALATPKKQSYHSIGLENTTCWQVFWVDQNILMGCYSDIGAIRSTDGGLTWSFNYNGFSVNSVYRMLATPNGNLYSACSNIHDMYQSTRLADAQLDANDSNGKIVFSTDKGQNWSNLKVFNHPVFWLASDPNDPKRLYASVIQYGGTAGAQQGGIYVTTNLDAGLGAIWNKLPNPPRTEGHPASIVVLNDGKVLCSFSGRRGSSGFTASSGVFLYDPATNSWADRSDTGMQYWTKDIIVDPTDATQNTWYAAVFSGWGGAPNGKGGLYRTTNRGQSWTKLTGSQFDRVTSITFNPQKNNQAYLTTETNGLWISDNMNAATPIWKLVDAYPFRQPERVYFNPFNLNALWVSSFGNGMRVGVLGASATQEALSEIDVEVWPNPVQNVLHVRLKNLSEARLMVYDVNGKLIANQFLVEGLNDIPVENLGPGVYFYSVWHDAGLVGSGKFVRF